jgi:hypothetical protein
MTRFLNLAQLHATSKPSFKTTPSLRPSEKSILLPSTERPSNPSDALSLMASSKAPMIRMGWHHLRLGWHQQGSLGLDGMDEGSLDLHGIDKANSARLTSTKARSARMASTRL